MPIFTAIAAAISTAAAAVSTFVAGLSISSIAAFAARTLLTIGIAKLIANRTGSTANGAQDSGARIQLPPASNNKIPIVYGSAFVAPTITDAKISEDQKTMWYVCALSEVSDTGSIDFDKIYYNGSLVTFDGVDLTKVVSLTNNANPPQVDTKINGSLYMYLFPNGSYSGQNTALSAIDIMSDASIPAGERWDGPIYTDSGQSADMTNLAFIIVKIVYNQNAGTTNLGQLNVQVINSLTWPGEVLLDYMTNVRYGCGIPLSRIDTGSLDDLDAYSQEYINYIDVNGDPATTQRYFINGPINTGNNCMTNIQQLVDACDSWIQYNEIASQWRIVINRSYTDYTTIDQLYNVNSNNLIGGIDVNPIDLNNTFNSLEVQYPDANIKDQTNFKVLDLEETYPELLSPNEPDNRLVITYPQVNSYIQALYLGERRLLQGREDLIINFALDYSGIQIDAGDVITESIAEYGWDVLNSGYGKLFRVSQVQETKDESGFLGVRITAMEYNDTIYGNDPIQDYIPEMNTGLSDPNIIGNPGTPTATATSLSDGNLASITVTTTVPTVGSVLYLDFNYGTNSDPATHQLYKTVSKSDGSSYSSGESVSIVASNLLPDTYYWSVTARNMQAGTSSSSSTSIVWSGMNVTNYDISGNIGGIVNSQVSSNAIATMNVQYNAITNSVSAYTSGNQVVGGWADIQTVTLTTVGERVFINSACDSIAVYDVDNGVWNYSTFRLARDDGITLTILMQSGDGTGAMSYSEAPAAGTYTYRYQAYSGAISYYPSVQNRSLFAMETKR